MIKECGDDIPIVTGFFGNVPGSLLTQVGRGYTDFCAALCAIGVGAEELQLYIEADGIFTADPKRVKSASLIHHITPDEAAELVHYGAERVHPFTIDYAMTAGIPIRIKNVSSPNGHGTVIVPPAFTDGNSKPSLDPSYLTPTPALVAATAGEANKDLPTAVIVREPVVIINVHSDHKTISHTFMAKLFAILEVHEVMIVDLIATGKVSVTFGIDSSLTSPLLLDRLIEDLSVIGQVTCQHNMAILSLVGRRMQNRAAIIGKMFSALAMGDINVEAISQDGSTSNITCIIDATHADQAINLIHDHLLLNKSSLPASGFWGDL